jgi:hypothetical protein
MMCDFCKERIKQDMDYYVLEIKQCNTADDRENSYDVWVACETCFSKIEKMLEER